LDSESAQTIQALNARILLPGLVGNLNNIPRISSM